MSKVDWSPVALRDLQRLYFFLLPKDPDAAAKALIEIRRSANRLEEFPLSGAPVGSSGFRKLNVSGEYAVVYRARRGTVTIARVHHLFENWKRR